MNQKESEGITLVSIRRNQKESEGITRNHEESDGSVRHRSGLGDRGIRAQHQKPEVRGSRPFEAAARTAVRARLGSTQKHSEALRGNQKQSEAIRGTHRRTCSDGKFPRLRARRRRRGRGQG